MKKAFAPATIANVACGFDVLGLALESPGDTVTAELIDEPGIIRLEIEGDDGRLPTDPGANTAGVAAKKLIELCAPDRIDGISLKLEKGLPLASGMGSSAASAVAAVVAVSDLLSLDADRDVLLESALSGEEIAAGASHADNAAACLYGGLVLVRRTHPADVVRLPVPEGLSVALVHPHLEVSTRDSRVLLGDEVRLKDAVAQWADLGSLVAGLYTEDWDLISRSLVDHIAEPIRSSSVPGFEAAKTAALETGALGCSLSGSGPSMFALCRDRAIAESAATSMAHALDKAAGLESDVFVSPVSHEGARPEIQSCAS